MFSLFISGKEISWKIKHFKIWEQNQNHVIKHRDNDNQHHFDPW